MLSFDEKLSTYPLSMSLYASCEYRYRYYASQRMDTSFVSRFTYILQLSIQVLQILYPVYPGTHYTCVSVFDESSSCRVPMIRPGERTTGSSASANLTSNPGILLTIDRQILGDPYNYEVEKQNLSNLHWKLNNFNLTVVFLFQNGMGPTIDKLTDYDCLQSS